MSNKPSWEDAPEEANILVQSANGKWIFGSYKDAYIEHTGWNGKRAGIWFFDTQTEADKPSDNWRQSLEHRPTIETSSPEEEREFERMESRVKPNDGDKYHRDIFDIKGNDSITVDVYSVLAAFEVTNPALQHLIKKALCAGLRGHKNEIDDMTDIIESAYRAKDMAGS